MSSSAHLQMHCIVIQTFNLTLHFPFLYHSDYIQSCTVFFFSTLGSGPRPLEFRKLPCIQVKYAWYQCSHMYIEFTNFFLIFFFYLNFQIQTYVMDLQIDIGKVHVTHKFELFLYSHSSFIP